MKKIIYMIMLTIMLSGFTAYAKSPQFEIGTYYQMGKYNNEPILWRCIDIDDENGVLLLSDKILTYKAFDKEYYVDGKNTNWTSWEGSLIRHWLNSDTSIGENKTIFTKNNLRTSLERLDSYTNEAGFLNPTNFSRSERNLMKTVSQWNILPCYRLTADKEMADKLSDIDELSNLSTNGIKAPWGYNYNIGSSLQYSYINYNNISQFSHVEGAMYRLDDTVFLLDQSQLYDLWKKEGTVKAEPTNIALNLAQIPENVSVNKYWVRYASNNCAGVTTDDDLYDTIKADLNFIGIRPAFYLNENNIKILSGEGSKLKPYVVDGEENNEISVFCNGVKVSFDNPPINYNDRILVPMRNIFETLEVSVSWDEKSRIVTASAIEKNISFQIGNNIMYVNGNPIILDVEPKIINNKTYIPIRAVAEAFGARVNYIDSFKRVLVDKPKLPMDFGEGNGLENWQNPQYIDNINNIYGIDLNDTFYDPEIYSDN